MHNYKEGVFEMKRVLKMVALLLVVILTFSTTAEASEKSVEIDLKLKISNNTATCKAEVSNSGYMIYVTLYLYRDGSTIMSWTRSGTSLVDIDETYAVTAGHTYYIYAYVTTNGHSYSKQSKSISI